MDINSKIAANRGLIFQQLSRFGLRDDPDAESLAYEALYKAILSFDDTRGNAFSTYAVCVIANALRMHIRSTRRKQQLEVISYNDVINNDDSEAELLHFIPDTTYNPENIVLFSELQGVVKQAFEGVLSRFSEKQQEIIVAWYRSDFKATQCEIAAELHVSQAMVSRSISAFKHKLKKELEEYYEGRSNYR